MRSSREKRSSDAVDKAVAFLAARELSLGARDRAWLTRVHDRVRVHTKRGDAGG